jgi:CRISPR-associated endoribonuclease Cas6
MRLILSLSRNKEPVPFNYQRNLVGAVHKWLGKNKIHDEMSLYSISWLGQGNKVKDGFSFPQGTTWCINSYDTEILKKLVVAIQEDNSVAFGMSVIAIDIQEDPPFGSEQVFRVQSPIFIKRKVDNETKFYYYNDEASNRLMTETLQNKLQKAGLNADNVEVSFLNDYAGAKVKKVTYNKVDNLASFCPIKIKGSPEQIAFAWNVGIGNSTGIGFGSLI